MHISTLSFAIANLIFANPQAPDSSDLTAAILRETVGYSSAYASRFAKGPMFIDVASFKKHFESARLGPPAESKLFNSANRPTSKNAKRSDAVLTDSRGYPGRVAENGVFVELMSLRLNGDIVIADFLQAVTLPSPEGVKDSPSRVGFELIRVVLKRSVDKWRLLRRDIIAQS